MAILVYGMQVIGILIPLVGIVALLRRSHQSNSSLYLMVTNMASLFMNAAYFLMMNAEARQEAMIVGKLEYMGSALFYYFFICFLVSYFWKKYPKWPFYIWAGMETLIVFLDLNGIAERLGLKEAPIHIFQKNPMIQMYSARMGQNGVYVIRYCLISSLLIRQ